MDRILESLPQQTGGKTVWSRPIQKVEIDQKTSHNTYQIDGLPPTASSSETVPSRSIRPMAPVPIAVNHIADWDPNFRNFSVTHELGSKLPDSEDELVARVLAGRGVAPEAVDGGPIAFVNEGDRIIIDVVNHTIDLDVAADELERRKADWKLPEPRYTSGFLAKYAKLAQGAETDGGKTHAVLSGGLPGTRISGLHGRQSFQGWRISSQYFLKLPSNFGLFS